MRRILLSLAIILLAQPTSVPAIEFQFFGQIDSVTYGLGVPNDIAPGDAVIGTATFPIFPDLVDSNPDPNVGFYQHPIYPAIGGLTISVPSRNFSYSNPIWWVSVQNGTEDTLSAFGEQASFVTTFTLLDSSGIALTNDSLPEQFFSDWNGGSFGYGFPTVSGFSGSITHVSVVPEPGVMSLLALAIGTLVAFRRRYM